MYYIICTRGHFRKSCAINFNFHIRPALPSFAELIFRNEHRYSFPFLRLSNSAKFSLSFSCRREISPFFHFTLFYCISFGKSALRPCSRFSRFSSYRKYCGEVICRVVFSACTFSTWTNAEGKIHPVSIFIFLMVNVERVAGWRAPKFWCRYKTFEWLVILESN